MPWGADWGKDWKGSAEPQSVVVSAEIACWLTAMAFDLFVLHRLVAPPLASHYAADTPVRLSVAVVYAGDADGGSGRLRADAEVRFAE